MPEIKRLPAILYLERSRLWYYTAASPNVLQVDFPQDIVNDLEVLNKEKLNELIKAFVGANKIDPANIMILLSPDITFEKDFPEGLPVEIEGETKNFLNFVPFEDTYSRPIKIGKTVKVVAVNKELCNGIKSAFMELQFSVTSLIPFSVLHQTIPELANNLDLAFILNHADSIKQYNLSGVEISSEGVSTVVKNPQTKDNKRQLIFVGIFVVLLIILGFVVYTNVIAPPTSTPPTSVVIPNNSQNKNASVSPTTGVPLSPAVIASPAAASQNSQ